MLPSFTMLFSISSASFGQPFSSTRPCWLFTRTLLLTAYSHRLSGGMDPVHESQEDGAEGLDLVPVVRVSAVRGYVQTRTGNLLTHPHQVRELDEGIAVSVADEDGTADGLQVFFHEAGLALPEFLDLRREALPVGPGVEPLIRPPDVAP